MPLLFSYGTLQRPEVQLSTFGRLLHGQEDVLPAFETELVKIEEPAIADASGRTHYLNATFTGNTTTQVRGMVFEITEAELAAADRYEQAASYVRVPATLASGKQAWMYVDARSIRR